MRSTPIFPWPLGRTILAMAIFCGPAAAQPALTTIQDTLYKADGTRFNGTLNIHWSTFDVTNVGTIVQQSKSVSVTNGNLQVSLAPNLGAQPPMNIYTVQYESDGREQFTETWTVPVSSTSLKVASVRTGSTTSGGGGGGVGNSTPIVESTVIGLVADLNLRPIKGPGFGTGSVAVINQDGQIETAVGVLGDCVLVDGTTGPCGGVSSTYYDAETPGGVVDGSNASFTLANAPSGQSLMLFRNGLYMKAGFDYTLTNSALQFAAGATPQPMDTLVASYRVDPTAGSTASLRASSSNLSNSTLSTTLAQVICSSGGRGTNSVAAVSLGSCDVPASAMAAGDRIEVRFNFVHTGTASAFDIQVAWGSTTILARHGGAQDAAVAGQAEASIASTGAQVSVQSWGTMLPFLPAIVSSPAQSGVKIDLRGHLSTASGDSIGVSNFTVLRYPAK